MQIQPLELAELALARCQHFAGLASRRGVRLEVTGSSEAWAAGDADRLAQVLDNLLDNAIRYSPPDSTIAITLRDQGAFVQLDVKDAGHGIPPTELTRIFERFYRVDKARTREQGGTGLGLSIARQIMERLHGRIWAESDGRSGSTFSFTLPAATPETPEPTAEIISQEARVE